LALGTERSGLIDRGNERSDVLDQTLKHAGRASSLLVEGLGGENGEAGEHSVQATGDGFGFTPSEEGEFGHVVLTERAE
jgi:hypothetical protein